MPIFSCIVRHNLCVNNHPPCSTIDNSSAMENKTTGTRALYKCPLTFHLLLPPRLRHSPMPPLNINGLGPLIGLMMARRRHIHVIRRRRLHSLRPVRVRVRRRARPIAGRLGRRGRITIQRLRQVLWSRSTRVLARRRKVLIERRGLTRLLLLSTHVNVRRVRRYRRVATVVVRRHHGHV